MVRVNCIFMLPCPVEMRVEKRAESVLLKKGRMSVRQVCIDSDPEMESKKPSYLVFRRSLATDQGPLYSSFPLLGASFVAKRALKHKTKKCQVRLLHLVSETAFTSTALTYTFDRAKSRCTHCTTGTSGMTLNKTCSAKTLSPPTFRLFEKDSRLALETLHLYSIWFDTWARSGQRRRRQLLYKSASIHFTFGSLSQFKSSFLQHSKHQSDLSPAINLNNSQKPPSLSRTNAHTTMLSCCQPDRKYKKVASEEEQQKQRKKDQTTAEQAYLDQVALEEYTNKRLAGPPRSNLSLSSGLRSNHYLR